MFLVTKSVGFNEVVMLSAIQIQSYFYRIGKTGPIKKAIAFDKLIHSLLCVEKQLSTDFIDRYEEFIHSVIHKGTDNESYLNTRIRLYNTQTKGSKNTLTNTDSLYVSNIFCVVTIDVIYGIDKANLYKNGWNCESGITFSLWPPLFESRLSECRKFI